MLIIVLIIILLILYYEDIETFITRKSVCVEGNCYSVVGKYTSDTHDNAAKYLNKIRIMYRKLLSHLKNKYKNSPKNSREKIITDRLLRRYDPDTLSENAPTSKSNTSYVQSKGELIRICLREKLSGKNKLHSWGIIQFVALHEISHIGDENYGHGPSFWRTFKFILKEAQDAQIYTPTRYRTSPENYCGIRVTYNPLHDESLKI